ncbi:CRISPR-associated protein Cas5 [Hanamia caeni]|uniref:CRISPR-associated protein Cas5 n=1 Tax=Hanamia caeni TaxID=2294116 RepID=A0A3M9NG07_9BACT|nr:CRISPR-associated protein Cas5 [Hanamia caeni]RNI36724.1 CRISPR-associated protein Cas5 [Hanamia caeni]
MKAFQFMAEGNWGHFKKPETNNNPLTHDLITKTGVIGLIGAVLGVERQEMKKLFPQLSDNLLYAVQLLSQVKKVSWGFTSRTAINPTAPGSPKYFEFLRNPAFKITLALKNDASQNEFENFLAAIKNNEAIYTPVLGWHNCPANLKFESEGTISEMQESEFGTSSFVSTIHKPKVSGQFRVGFDKLPTYQNDDFWNLPDKYQQIIYPDFPYKLIVEGKYYHYQNTEQVTENLWLM